MKEGVHPIIWHRFGSGLDEKSIHRDSMDCGETVVSKPIEDAVKASKGLLSEIHDGECERGEPLEAPRRADAEEHAHEQPQILRRERNDVALLHVLDSAKPGASCSSGGADVREASFESLRSKLLKPSSLGPAHPTAVAEKCFSPFARLVSPAPLRRFVALRDVRANSVVLHFGQRTR